MQDSSPIRSFLHRPALLSVCFGVLAATACAAPPADTSPASPDLSSNAVFAAWQGNADVQRCGYCHYEPGNAFAERSTEFCRLTELKQWLQADKHALARQRIEPIAPEQRDAALQRIKKTLDARNRASVNVPDDWIGDSNFLSFAICQKLGYDVGTDEGFDRFRTHCLTCHGGYAASTQAQPTAGQQGERPGISCTYCHQTGPQTDWIDRHSSGDAASQWRGLPPQTKAEHGMRNLASPSAQAELCYSCHIGDLKRGMFVTHAMYAAGHPPLPSVELSALIDAMPRHWRTPQELYKSLPQDEARDAYFRTTYPVLQRQSGDALQVEHVQWKTDAMLHGGLTGQQQVLQMLVHAADPASQAWGDYALYDCAACHHALKIPSPRQNVHTTGAPGRPRLLTWPQTLSGALDRALGQPAELAEAQSKLELAMTQRPFGDRQAVAAAATQLNKAFELLKSRVAERALDRQFSIELLNALATTPDDLMIDYQAARQVNWAIRGIDAELAEQSEPLPEAVRAAIHTLGTGGEPREALVSTELPGGQHRQIFPAFVRAELQRQADYDSEIFLEQLDAIALSLVESSTVGR